MPPSITDQRVLVHHSNFITAIWLQDDTLLVYRSPLVTELELPDPVKKVLNLPHRIVSSEVVVDNEMMFGKAYSTVYRLI